MITPIVVTTKW